MNQESLTTPSQQQIPDLGQHPAHADVHRDGDDALAVHTRGLTKRYGRRTVVDSLDITVPAGVVAGFVGPNGAGKTTTLRMLLGLVRPSAGGGRVLGAPLTRPASYLHRVGALIESPAFYPNLSGTRNRMVQATLGGLDPARIPALLERVNLAERARDACRTYSLVSEVQQACDWLVMIKEGQRVFRGSTAQLLASGGDELVLGCQHPADLPRLGDMLGRRGLNWARDGNRLRVPLRHLQDLEHARGLTDQIAGINRAAMAEDLTLIELTTTHASLEDRYESLMAEGAR